MALKKIQEEFASWLLMSKRACRVHGLPLTYEEWAEWKGVASRTMRRWRESPEFQEHLEQRRLEIAREVTPNSTVTAEGVGGPRNPKDKRLRDKQLTAPEPATEADDPVNAGEITSDEQSYLKARDTLISMAENGSTEALNLYFKHYGQHFIEAERSASSELSDLSDEELASQVIQLLGEETVATVLAGRAVSESGLQEATR